MLHRMLATLVIVMAVRGDFSPTGTTATTEPHTIDSTQLDATDNYEQQLPFGNPFREGGEVNGCNPGAEACYDDTSRRRSFCVEYRIPDCEGCRGRRRITVDYVANRRRSCKTLPESAAECAARDCQGIPTESPTPAPTVPTDAPTPPCKDKNSGQCCVDWFYKNKLTYCKTGYWQQLCPIACGAHSSSPTTLIRACLPATSAPCIHLLSKQDSWTDRVS